MLLTNGKAIVAVTGALLCLFLLRESCFLSTVLYHRYPAECGTTAGLKPIYTYSMVKMKSTDALTLWGEILKSGIILPESKNKFSGYTEKEIRQFLSASGQELAREFKERKHGGIGGYYIGVVKPGDTGPSVEISWSGEKAAESIWPLVDFLDKHKPTGTFAKQPRQ